MTRPTTTLTAAKRQALRLMLKGMLKQYIELLVRDPRIATPGRA